ncbi:D-amino-acid oxidase [Rhipicephalus sanguineus]|uniref:D-amino-acid oxidase n=1 Tax=Rhipicephalus sanguineus TaxID=34632 RepID=UPI0018939384|nr:D-amino-acid oxidase [Rhipicephalus sanguineus]
MTSPWRVAVVGGGIVGLSAAVRIAEEVEPGNIHVTVLAEHFSPHTTGDVAAGFFDPYIIHGVSEEKLRYGSYMISLTIECKKFLPYLMERLQSRGGRLMQCRVKSLEEIADEYDVIVNCTGFGAGAFVNDPKVHAIRGQTIRVHAPWIKHAIIAGDHFHVIPNIDDVMLGGTADVDETSLIPDRDIASKIWNGCLELAPSLKNAKVIGHFVGLRPGRNPVRIEREDFTFKHGVGKVPVIHNYGHGGSGITIAWGCAGDVVRLVQDSITERSSDWRKTEANL